MRRHIRLFIALAVFASVPMGLVACLWDYDTLKQERARFPSALELITGKFPRNSPAFYQWRITDRLKKLATDPNQVNLYDDLAVAYEKTGQHAKAIETILAKEKVKPGLYETYSNLGTFHILAGDFELGLPYIDKALAINPDAHFGREKYQKWLVEYAISKRVAGKLVLPLQTSRSEEGIGENTAPTFDAYLLHKLGGGQLTENEAIKAVKGVLGMMRFANHENPILLEALGDLLLRQAGTAVVSDAKRLASRAYLKASYSVKDPSITTRYRELAAKAIHLQTYSRQDRTTLTLLQLEADFGRQLDEAEHWYKAVADNEALWIRENRDVDAEFDKQYQVEPVSTGEQTDNEMNLLQQEILAKAWDDLDLVLLAVAALLLSFIIGMILHRRMREPDKQNKRALNSQPGN